MEEALLEAEERLGRSRDELEIEVIRQPKRGLFGLRQYDAVIHASIKLPSEEINAEEQDDEAFTLDGSVQIVDGKIKVIDPAPEGLKPTITPGPNVHIIVNGKLIETPAEVTAEDDIVVMASQAEAEWEPQLRVTEDNLQAFLALNRIPGNVFKIQDSPPQRELLIKAKLVETIEPQVNLDDVNDYLKEANIVFGLDDSKLRELVEEKETKEILVAQGQPAQPAQDAYLKLVYLKEEDIDEDDEEKKVERVARHAVISVEPGDLLVELVPPVEGQPGRDVYGRVIPVKPPKKIEIIPGNGVNLDQLGTRAFAAISGRPEVTGARVAVHPSYVLSGDVDAKVGRIDFKGDVQILGNVQDEMSIEATGQVVINGYAANANITAGGSVIVHNNIVGCTVRAGGLGTIAGKMIITLDVVKKGLPQLLAAGKQLLKHPSFAQNRDVARVGEGIVLRMLLSNKFNNLPQKLKDSLPDVEKLVEGLDYAEIRAFAEEFGELQQKLTGNGPLTLKTLEDAGNLFDSFIKRSDQIITLLKEKTADKANLVTGYIQNSHLECSGEVIITGKGSYNSNIYAGQDVTLKGSPGTFRGGEINAGGNVVAREIGSPAEVATEVRINPGKSVKADRVHPGVAIYAGSKLERITQEENAFVIIGQE